MISNKKSYAMKMLQLALALSLLHVDPDNFLQQRLRNWDSQLELREGDGWELEMLRAVPMVEYPYANRKTMMPLIEDLVLFDRQHDAHNQYNVTAYLLNIQNDGANQTAAVQELQQPPVTTTSAAAAISSGATALEHAAASVTVATGSANGSSIGLTSPEIDLFLNSEQFQDQRSVWEQNIADLHDFGDFSVLNPYSGLPLKDEPLDNAYFDVHLEAFLPGFNEDVANELKTENAGALNDTFPDPGDIAAIKVEQIDNNEEHQSAALNNSDDIASCSSTSTTTVCVKEEENESNENQKNEENIKKEVEQEQEQEQEEEEEHTAVPLVDLSPFISSNLELTKEESEIVEVLWKQDVDLGYSLMPPKLSDVKNDSNDNVSDDIEKLKALEELKDDELNDKLDNNDINDEWAGIPFTVDNETGEYIRLPLDELLNDVLQLAELAGENNIGVTSDNTAASISKINTVNSEDGFGNDIGYHNDGIKVNEEQDKIKEENNKSDKDISVAVEGKGAKLSNKKHDNDNTNNNNNNNGDNDDDALSESEEIEDSSLPSPLFDLDDEAKEELADFDMMLQSSFHHHHHHTHPHRPSAATAAANIPNYAVGSGANSAFHRQAAAATGFHHGHHQGRMPLNRGVSMEQRLQDIASLFNPIPGMGVVGGVSDMPPYPHYPTHHYSYQNAAAIPAPAQQYPPPPPPHPHHHGHHSMLHPNATIGDICSTQPHYGHNLGSAVSSSMHLTNASHEADIGGGAAGGAAGVGAYKMEHDMMYYSNASSDMNHTTDGFINSILNDEDLHLMDMNVNDNFCRMVDVSNNTSNNSSVLGLSSGGSGVSGHINSGGNNGAGSANNGLSIGGGRTGGTTAGGGSGMTSDMMNSTTQVGGGDRLDASSDSAVSSMGSERVPSLSDGEWGEGSDSAQDYHQGKYGGPYDYSYNNNTNRPNDGTRQPPVAQKKHQMFGKRYLNEQPGIVNGTAGGTAGTAGSVPATANNLLHGPAQSIKYEYEPYPGVAGGVQQSNGSVMGEGAMGPMLSKEHEAYDMKYGVGSVPSGGYSLDFSLRTPRAPHDIVQHNHTYTLPQGTGSVPRPQQRDKKMSTSSSKSAKSGGSSEDEHLTRDEKRARALGVPISVSDIINLPMDEFNERLSKYDLTETQLSLIRDIRRRGKNKVAAQNCRKRKLDQILSLEDEVKEVRRRKDHLTDEQDSLAVERKRISNKFAALHRHIFQYLRDPEGNPCSPSEYSLQQAADGSIYLLPRDNSNNKTDINNGANNTGAGSGGGAINNVANINVIAPHLNQQQHPHIPISSLLQNTQQQQQQQQQQHQQHHSHHSHHPQPHQKD